MSEIETVNATVTDVRVVLDRDFILTVYVNVKYQGALHQSVGGFVLGGLPDTAAGRHHEQPNLAAEWLVGVMRACGVTCISKAKGCVIRVQREAGFDGAITGIGHAVEDDCWFDPKKNTQKLLDCVAHTQSGGTQ